MKNSKNIGFARVLNISFEEALIKVQKALKEEGFGVLTTIDVQSTLKKKLDVDFRRYVILGACNPPYAFQALQADLDVGLLLPCNVIIYETDDNKVYVSTMNPVSVLGVIQNQELRTIADGVSVKLKKVIENVAR
ncbi:MAG: DUF302 domain-containing protein [Desulfobacterales bacterium]|jgi:uncharacterized protein (DUF302 family)